MIARDYGATGSSGPGRAAHQPALTAHSSTFVDGMASRQQRLERVATLTERLVALEHDRQLAIAEAVADSATWAEIGEALGVSAQAAHKRYRWLRHSHITGETWHEPPLPRPTPG